MGRPLNKKFFGNRNIGTNGYQTVNPLGPNPVIGDDGIGGEGVASYGTIVAGSGWTTNPDPYFSDPTIPGGVTVAGIVHYKALSFATTANGTGYAVGDVLEVLTGESTTKSRAPVASVVVIGTPNINAGGSNYDVTPPVGDRVTYTHANLSTPFVVEITAVNGGGGATSIEIVTPGVWTGSGAPPTSMAGGVNGFTATTSDGPLDNNGTGLVLDGFVWGVYSFGAVTVPGDYTAFPDTGTNGLLTNITSSGTGAKATITMGLLSVEITQKGSGYVNPADAALLFDNGAHGASAVAVLTTDSGTIYTSTNQENAIIIHANTDDLGTKVGDIIKQLNDRRYKVKTEDGTAKCILVTNNAPAFGEAYIKATDDNGNTYFVYKLTSRVATLFQWEQNGSNEWLFADGARAKWTLNNTFALTATFDTVVIENA